MNKKLHIFFLFLTALIWGTAFVAQRLGSEYVEPFTYLAWRSWAAVLFLVPLVRIMDRFFEKRGIDNRKPKSAADRKLLIIGGCLSGTMLFAASATQQIGITYTTASKAGFITALYVVLVPLLSVFIKKRPSPQIWACVALALLGLYLLCIKTEDFTLEYGDAWVLSCAFLFAVQILILSYFSPRVDAIRLSFVQFLVVAVLSTAFMLLTEHPTAENIRLALLSILYAGIFSGGIAYTLQIIGQDGVNPTIASLIMSLESVVDKKYESISAEMTLGDLVHSFSKSKSILLPVLDSDGQIIGEIDFTKIRHVVFRTELYHHFTVAQLMSQPPAILGINDNMLDVMKTFERTHAQQLPVCDMARHLIGYVSRTRMYAMYRKMVHDLSME